MKVLNLRNLGLPKQLIGSINESYRVDQEQASSLLFQYIVSIL
jgi:hypothetical protein